MLLLSFFKLKLLLQEIKSIDEVKSIQEVKKIEPVKNIYELTAEDVKQLKRMIREDKQKNRSTHGDGPYGRH